MVAADLAVLLESYVVAYYLRTHTAQDFSLSLPQLGHGLRGFSWILIIIVPAWIAALQSFGLYEASTYKSKARMALALSKAHLFASLVLFSAVFVLRQYAVSRSLLSAFVAVSFICFITEKIAARTAIRYRANRRRDAWRVLLVGEREDTLSYLNLVREHPDWNVEIVGVLESAGSRKQGRANGHHDPH